MELERAASGHTRPPTGRSCVKSQAGGGFIIVLSLILVQVVSCCVAATAEPSDSSSLPVVGLTASQPGAQAHTHARGQRARVSRDRRVLLLTLTQQQAKGARRALHPKSPPMSIPSPDPLATLPQNGANHQRRVALPPPPGAPRRRGRGLQRRSPGSSIPSPDPKGSLPQNGVSPPDIPPVPAPRPAAPLPPPPAVFPVPQPPTQAPPATPDVSSRR